MTPAEAQIITLLTEIRDLLLPQEVVESTECPHPEERRVSLSSFGDPNHWFCQACRYDNKAMN